MLSTDLVWFSRGQLPRQGGERAVGHHVYLDVLFRVLVFLHTAVLILHQPTLSAHTAAATTAATTAVTRTATQQAQEHQQQEQLIRRQRVVLLRNGAEREPSMRLCRSVSATCGYTHLLTWRVARDRVCVACCTLQGCCCASRRPLTGAEWNGSR